MRILEIMDKFNKIIYLTNERWKHIVGEHLEISSYTNFFEALCRIYGPQILSRMQVISQFFREFLFFEGYYKKSSKY